ncbi:hypothetical protein KC338_g169 [Hortaea werneckii]|nr:hypothetical protein KC338_g169 [Hortaea werneckii]
MGKPRLPPTLRVRTAFRALDKTLLHTIRHSPPFLHLRVCRHLGHIRIEVAADPFHSLRRTIWAMRFGAEDVILRLERYC